MAKKIMFSDKYGLTQAVLEGRKTMTRRIIKLPDGTEGIYDWTRSDWPAHLLSIRTKDGELHDRIPVYQVGEEVAIAQAYNDFYDDGCDPRRFPAGAGWNNKMFVRADLMPHTIRITDIKAERLQDISDADCIKEGIMEGEFMNTWDTFYYDHWGDVPNHITFPTARKAFASLIDKVSGEGTWARNPWVFVYSFELVR